MLNSFQVFRSMKEVSSIEHSYNKKSCHFKYKSGQNSILGQTQDTFKAVLYCSKWDVWSLYRSG
jgi:hypothetical protein